MQTMIQGRDGISWAQRAALKVVEVARQVSVVAALLAVAATLALTANTSFAGGKALKVVKEDTTIEDTVVVSNAGAILGGSVQTFSPGSKGKARPTLNLKGSATLLGGTNPSGDAVSSLDGHIVVALTLGNIVATFSNGANGNSAPDGIVTGPSTGINTPEGASFENPFAEVIIPAAVSQQVSSSDIYAVSNTLPIIVAPGTGSGLCGVAPAPGFSLGTITEFFSGEFGDTPPIGSPGSDGFTPDPANPPLGVLPAPATIAGCDTLLLGPVGVAFDASNNLWVVNELGTYVTEYAAGSTGNATPINAVGLLTPGTFIDPQFIAVGQFPNAEGTFVPAIFVTDAGDNSIKIFDVTAPFAEVLLGTIQGRHTHLRRPLGIASNSTFTCTDDAAEVAVPCDDLYVVNNSGNTLMMFDDLDGSGFGDVRPTVTIHGARSTLNAPVGVALQQWQQVLLTHTN
jgi:hypothetical protein